MNLHFGIALQPPAPVAADPTPDARVAYLFRHTQPGTCDLLRQAIVALRTVNPP